MKINVPPLLPSCVKIYPMSEIMTENISSIKKMEPVFDISSLYLMCCIFCHNGLVWLIIMHFGSYISHAVSRKPCKGKYGPSILIKAR